MKMKCVFLGFIWLFVSCNTAKEQKKESALKIKMPGIPLSWHYLTVTDTGSFIYTPCNAANWEMVLKESNDSIYLTALVGQMTFYYRVLKIDSIAKGKFDFICLTTDSSSGFKDNSPLDTLHFEAKDDKAGWTANSRTEKNMFIQNKDLKNYRLVNQACRECWDDAMCDEMEKGKAVGPGRILGEWVISSTISKSSDSEGEAICNVCPKITFYKDLIALVTFPDKSIDSLNWKVDKDTLTLKNMHPKTQAPYFLDHTYRMIFSKKEKHTELRLDLDGGYIYVLGQ